MTTHDSRTDKQLVDAANGGDDAAFEAIYVRYRGWTAALALRFCGDRETARDVTHEAFLWLLKKFPGFELRAKMKTVLYPVVRNIALTQHRKKTPQSRAIDLPDGHAAHHDGSAQALVNAVRQLPVGQREVLLLRFADDLSLAEIAAVLEIPLGTVKSRLHVSLAALRQCAGLKDFFDEQ